MISHEQLKARFANASQSFLALNSDAGNKGANPVIQKQQDGDSQVTSRQTAETSPPDYEARISKTDGSDNAQYRVSIIVRFSNKRRTDLPGKLDTLLDCVVRARRRLLDDNSAGDDPSRTVRTRKRGCDNRDRKAVVKEMVPF